MYITTYMKIHFEPLNPNPDDIRIEDIAHAQSLMTRANGHFPEFYSVAQHSIACAAEGEARGYSPRMILACLLHDASEAYLSDITRPVKSVLGGYQVIEKNLQEAIYKKFLAMPLSDKENTMIKVVDDACLYYEFEHYMGEKLLEKKPEFKSKPAFFTRPFGEVEQEFLAVFDHWKKLLYRNEKVRYN